MEPQQLLQIYLALWLAILGAALGSFLCCAADRGTLPTGRSRCDGCGHTLGARDLIPIFSYIASRGRCRHCGGAIPTRCLTAEVVGAAGFAALGLKFGPSPELVMQLILAALLLLLSLVDWTAHILPDKLLLAAVVNRLAGRDADRGGRGGRPGDEAREGSDRNLGRPARAGGRGWGGVCTGEQSRAEEASFVRRHRTTPRPPWCSPPRPAPATCSRTGSASTCRSTPTSPSARHPISP